MKWFGRFLLAVTWVVVARAQYSWLDYYTNTSSDASNVYATGVIQANPAASDTCRGNPNWCLQATHTYSQTLIIRSPSSRSNYCYFDQAYNALTSVNLSCQTVLPIDGEYSTFSIEDRQTGVDNYGHVPAL